MSGFTSEMMNLRLIILFLRELELAENKVSLSSFLIAVSSLLDTWGSLEEIVAGFALDSVALEQSFGLLVGALVSFESKDSPYCLTFVSGSSVDSADMQEFVCDEFVVDIGSCWASVLHT